MYIPVFDLTGTVIGIYRIMDGVYHCHRGFAVELFYHNGLSRKKEKYFGGLLGDYKYPHQ